MDCNKSHELIDLYIDGILSDEEKREFEKHINECSDCMNEVKELKELKNMLSNLPELDLPENFESELRTRLVEENEHKERVSPIRFINKYKFALSSVAATLVIALIVSTGGFNTFYKSMDEGSYDSNSSTITTYTTSAEYSEEAKMEMAESAPPMVEPIMARSDSEVVITFNEAFDGDNDNDDNYSILTENSDLEDVSSLTVTGVATKDLKTVETKEENLGRLIIHNGSLAIETEDYDLVSEKIVNRTLELNGFIMNSSNNVINTYQNNKEVDLNRGYFTLRIPAEHFYSFFDELSKFGEIINTSTYSDDITQNYRDTVSEIENLKIQEIRLREILKNAETVEDILSVEKELSRVRSEINNFEGTVKNWDRLIRMSTINVEVIEVVNLKDEVKPIDKNMLQKAKEGFIRSINLLKAFMERTFISIVSMLPIIIVICIVLLIGYFIYKIVKKKRGN